jgi:murein DD-endopeptidase MepM/ murein hydrolase activator NlpD
LDETADGRRWIASARESLITPRAAAVLAAADGIVTSVGTNGLGGNVVWEVRPLHGESLYYAHLETQFVKAGSYVKRGEVLGTVGNTGNARGGPAHLHFGIYAPGGAVDPLPYLASVPQSAKHGLVDHRRAAGR